MLRFPYVQLTLRRPVPTLAGMIRHVPVLIVGVAGPSGLTATRFRIDSGADDTILPSSVAAQLGVDLSAAPTAEAESANGAIVRYRCARVTLRISDGIEYCQWDAVVGFVPISRQSGLAGHAGFLNYFDVELLGGLEFTLKPTSQFPGLYGRH